jgi:integrase
LPAKQSAGEVYKPDVDDVLKERYATLFTVAAASGLRCAELFTLRINDLDFKAETIRVAESADQRTYIIGPCKNAAAYRTILLADREGREELLMLRRCLKGPQTQDSLAFRSKRGTALRETCVLHRFLHPVLRTLGFPQAGMHAFRHGCNRRWELSGMNPAVLRQQMRHSFVVMTARYTGEIRSTKCKGRFPRWNWKIWKLLENGRTVPAVA